MFNVGTGVETSLRQLLDVLLRVTDKQHIRPEFLPERTVNPVPRRLADVCKAERMLGFRSEVQLEEGLRRLVAWRRDVLQRGQQEAYEGPQAQVAGPSECVS